MVVIFNYYKNMFSKFLKILFIFIILLLPFKSSVLAIDDNLEEKIIINLFDDRLCPVCAATKDFIQGLQNEYPEIELNIYPISDTEKLNKIVQELEIENYRIMAPTIFINGKLFQFRDFTSQEEEIIISAIEGKEIDSDCCIVKIPFLNIEVDIRSFSLPSIAILLGLVDGFNVCSLGVLMLVLSIVIVFNSRKKIFLFGGIFIITTVIIYGSLVFFWGKLFEILVGQIEILRIIVGLAALGGSVYFFKEFYRFLKYGPTCLTSSSRLAQGAIERLQKAFEGSRKLYFLTGSIIFFAAVITIVELPCSIGIPIAFAGILAEKSLSLSNYVFYIILYLFFYMLDELIIFIGAVLTKKIWFSNSKIITWVTFLGAIILLFLAFHYLIGF